jgi:cytochrome c biogenesis protein CcmG/thiol:disulfide interchange protein DsbE
MRKLVWRIIPIVIFLLLSIFLWRGLSLDPHYLPSVKIGTPLPEMALPQLASPQKTFYFTALRGKVSLLNVWASWCEACVEEQVFMMQLARNGVPIYGLNYKDRRDDALTWLNQWGNPYQLIGQDKEGLAAIDLGVYGAPETFVIDKKGIIRYRQVGVMNQALWTNTIAPLMKQLEQEA